MTPTRCLLLIPIMALIAACGGSPAPPTTTQGGTTTTATSTTTTSTSTPPTYPGLPVDPSDLPAPAGGRSTATIISGQSRGSGSDGTSQFRTNCALSHMGWNDPIVSPGGQNRSHLHSFFGNTATDYRSTPESIRTAGNSTCWGGTANRSAYWAPTMIDTATNTPVVNSDPVDQVNFLQVYYKTGYQGVDPTKVQNYPVGLRMIAGSMMSTGPQSNVWYECGGPRSASIPSNCAQGSLLIMSVEFPQCWDGVNLDSPDHKSHMSWANGWQPSGFSGCPASHPVPLAQITQNYRYRVTSPTANWRLSSDTVGNGYSGHADWMNGWDPAVFQRVVDNCFRQPGGRDCSMNLLGDGTALG